MRGVFHLGMMMALFLRFEKPYRICHQIWARELLPLCPSLCRALLTVQSKLSGGHRSSENNLHSLLSSEKLTCWEYFPERKTCYCCSSQVIKINLIHYVQWGILKKKVIKEEFSCTKILVARAWWGGDGLRRRLWRIRSMKRKVLEI